jgi:hypothetical protein
MVPKLTAMSSLIDNPIFWRGLLKRLSGGTDTAHDIALLNDLHASLGIHPRTVWAKMRTHCHPSTGSMH